MASIVLVVYSRKRVTEFVGDGSKVAATTSCIACFVGGQVRAIQIYRHVGTIDIADNSCWGASCRQFTGSDGPVLVTQNPPGVEVD